MPDEVTPYRTEDGTLELTTTLTPDALKAFFKWVSSSIKSTSQSIGQATADAPPINLPPPPAQTQIVP